MPALGQKFMPTEIVEAETITPEMNERIMIVVDPPLLEMRRPKNPEDVTEARKQLQQLFRANQPTVEYLEALSAAIESRIQEAVEHESALVRINAMIVLSSMVDDGSKKWVDQALNDAEENDAVKRWAMEALGKRMVWWKTLAAAGARGNQVKIDDAIKQIIAIISDATPSHPVVVSAALEALARVDTTSSREALIDLINKRVALHKADPDLTFVPERAAIETLSNALVIESPPDVRSMTGLSRAMSRYSSLILDQFQANRMMQEHEKGAQTMLYQCFSSLARVSAAAKVAVPVDPAQAKNLIGNGRWDELKGFVEKEWAAALAANPFNLKAADLKP